MQGTIPYLGTFLTDLTMLDTALPDFVEVGWLLNGESLIVFLGGSSTACLSKHCPPFFPVLQGGLINFEKRRRVSVAPLWHNQSVRFIRCSNFHLVPAGV